MTLAGRSGFIAGGNFIIDHVKMIDIYPSPDMLANISSQYTTNGGGPYNVLTNLARMAVDVPLEAVGKIGNDDNGRWIHNNCLASGIQTAQLQSSDEASTSYTDVMSLAGTGQRTFFHHRGANALLGPDDFNFAQTSARLFHLAYLLLLDRLDQIDHEGNSAARKVLAAAHDHGLITSADMVSVQAPNAAALVRAVGPSLDYLFLNEIEAERLIGRPLREPDNRPRIQCILDAAAQVHALGIREEVIIHFSQGAVAYNARTGGHLCGSVKLPDGFEKGCVGAGDAFAAGYLWGVHEQIDTATRLQWAACTAAMSLSHPTPSQGVKPMDECLELGRQYGFKHLPPTSCAHTR